MKLRTALLGAGAAAALFGVPPIRRNAVSARVVRGMKALEFLPQLSQAEKTAIEAGTVWVDGELVSGKPDFQSPLREAYPGLTPEEQAFLDGPVEEVCRMTDDWEVQQ